MLKKRKLIPVRLTTNQDLRREIDVFHLNPETITICITKQFYEAKKVLFLITTLKNTNSEMILLGRE